MTNLLETAQDIFTRADSVLDNLQGFVTDVRGPLTDTINNAKKFSEALGNNADGVDDFLASVTKLSEQLAGASDKLDATLEAAEGLLKSVDKEKVAQIVDNVEKLSANLSATSDRIDGVVDSRRDDVRASITDTSITEFSDGARQRWRRSTTSSAVSIPRRCARRIDKHRFDVRRRRRAAQICGQVRKSRRSSTMSKSSAAISARPATRSTASSGVSMER